MKSKPSDYALTIFKAALNLVPVVGGAIASLVSDAVPSSKQRAVENACEMVAEKIATLEDRIKPDAINKDDFVEICTKFLAVVSRTNREEKLQTAANILANALLPPNDPQKSTYDELDHLMHCVDTLTSGAIAALGASIQITPPRHASRGDTPFRFAELHRKMKDQNADLLFSLATELRSLNLLHITEGIINSNDYENYLFRVTPMGSRFAERFIEGRM